MLLPMIPLVRRGGCCMLAILLIVGCSREARLYPVSGSVSLDGQPVSEGDIVFHSPDGVRGPDAGKIEGGNYALKTTEGKKRVEISASKIRPGGARGAGGEPVPEEYISARYNLESTLTAEVQARDINRFDFSLESK
jgi:hypothetical protein